MVMAIRMPTTPLIQLGGPGSDGVAVDESPNMASTIRVTVHPSRPRGPARLFGNIVVSAKPIPNVTANPTAKVSRALAALPGGRRAENSTGR